MILAFELSMPGNNSWNSKWSGEGRSYVIVKTFTAKKLIEQRSFHYSWGDGWGARIDVREVDAAEARKLRKNSLGFCGYDWMVKTIIDYGQPMADHEVKEYLSLMKGSETCSQ